MQRPRVIHIEVGGSYGGSTRALELYLKHTDRAAFEHDVLFYHATPGWERLRPVSRQVTFLDDPLPAPAPARRSEGSRALRHRLARSRTVRDARTVLSVAREFSRIRRLHHLMSQGGYAVVHVNNTFTYQPLSVIAAALASCPVVGHIRNPVDWTPLTRWLSSRLDTLVSVNRRFVEEAREAGARCGVRTCYDGIEVTVPPPEVVSRLRRELLGEGRILVGSVGRLDPQKGYSFLVRAAREVIDRRPEVTFVVAGSGSLEDALRGEIRRLGLDGRFRLLGFRSDVPAVIAALDVFVSSSLWEGLPLAVFEAMLLKRPVVATDAGGTREIVGGGAGTLVPCADPGALARGILELLDDQALASRHGAAGMEAARPFTELPALAAELDGVFRVAARSCD